MPEIEDESLERRELLRGSLAFLAVVPLCCSTPELPAGAVRFEGDRVYVDLKLARELQRVGAARAIVDTARKVNIIVAHVEKGRFAALDRTCTHGGAQCSYDHKRRTLRCTSLNHAEYDLDGTLLHGRTHGNLRAYDVRVVDGGLEICREA